MVIGNQNVTSGTSINVYAIARDAYDNFVVNVMADSWALLSSSGGIVPTDLVPSEDMRSATFTGRLAGTAVIGAAVSGLSAVPSGTLTVVVAGVPSQIRVESAANGTGTVVADRSIPSGSSFTVYAVGRDAAGNFVSNVAADSWSLQNKTGGVVDGNLAVSADRRSATFTATLLGTSRVRATSGSLATTSSGTLTVIAGPASTIAATAGTPQSTHVGTAFPTRLQARARDAAGNPAKGVLITWSAPTSGASGTFAAGGSAATTDSTGNATSGVFTANILAGSYTVTASLPLGVASAPFLLTNTYGVAARVGTAAGSPQSTQVAKPFAVPLEASVTDSSGNAVGGVSVTFTAPATGPSGTFPGNSRTAVVITNTTGIAKAPAFVANNIVGSYRVVATVAGVDSGTVFELTNMSGAPGSIIAAAGTPQSAAVGAPFAAPLKAIVRDSSGNLLSGVLVTFTAPSTGASGTFDGGLVDSVVTDGTGTATASTLTANAIVGSFTLLARAPSVSTPAAFLLTNQPSFVDTFLIDAAGGGPIGTQIAQVPFNIRVRANDEFGNVSTAFAGTADLSSNGVLGQAGTTTAPFTSGVLASHTVAMQNAGRFIITATRTGGAETGRSDTFAVINPTPTVTKVTPSSGRRGQTLSVTLLGTGFLPGVTTVSFGDMIATSTSVISGTEMTVTISIDTAAATGPRDVYIFNGSPGGGVGSLAGAFVVINNPAPSLTSLIPTSGAVLQRLTLECTGTNFYEGLTGVDAGEGITVNSITFDSSTHMSADISINGSAVGGMRSIYVSNDPPGGGISQGIPFHVSAPPTTYPVPESPANDEAGVDTNLTFRWHPWMATGVVYWLQVSTNNTFIPTVVDDSTIADTTKRVTSLARGVKYYWRVFARNDVGNSDPSPVRSFTPSFEYPATISLSDSVWFPMYSSKGEYQTKEYRLVGIPGNCNVPVRSFLPGEKDVDWVVFWDNGAASNYLVPFDGTANFNFVTGRAFWILNKGPMKIVASVPTVPLDSSRCVTIPLRSGWNLITNPFMTTVQWASVQNANGSGILPDIWMYNGTFARTSAFKPGVGYMFDNADNLPALRIPLGWAAAKGSVLGDASLWRIHIQLSSESVTDEATSIGLSPMASQGRDRLDQRMPRGIGQLPGAYFERPGWDPDASVFATDIRRDIDAIETWPMSVRAAVQEPAQLSFSGIPEVPPQYRVLLIDDDHGKSADLRENSVYRFTPARSVSRFRIVVGSEDAAQDVLDALLPRHFALGQNFPNPFNPTTTIPIAVPRHATLVLRVYTILGEEVQTLFSGPLGPGHHWFVWDGKSADGHNVSSGVYLIRLTVDGGQHLIGKMLLMK